MPSLLLAGPAPPPTPHRPRRAHSPSPNSRQAAQVNPQVSMASNFGATNKLPAFIQPNGPVRVVRFVRNSDGSPDGGVHDLFTITGRSDAAGCNVAQPDFDAALAQRNA